MKVGFKSGSKVILPRWGFSSPRMPRMRVVLPEPLGPTMQMKSSGSMERLRFFRTA